ncbi:hypothetical protein [Agromyces ramosus]|uniref:Minor tail protein n=1 Tax=Agromyces ramosus TaxID=33879 RepID=A0ABU0R8M7_9MICO|nr:hypothetical protein [Agromyces ramosus]MDQ0894420.1 hypothetical protein [Agromyces ramosus]
MVDNIWPVNAVTGAPSYTGRKLRQTGAPAFAGATSARPLGARTGVRPGTSPTTVTATSSLWTVQPFAGAADLHTAVEAGPYQFAFDAVATGAVTAAHASLTRIDIIYVQIDDPAEADGSSVPAATRKYLAGTAGSGIPPTTPARSFVIAHLNVPISGGGAPAVTWVAPYMAAAGATVRVKDAAQRDLTSTWSQGDEVQRLDTDATELRDAVGWRSRSNGWVSFTPTLQGITIGNGTIDARYRRDGDCVDVEFSIGWGTTTSAAGAFGISFPFAGIAKYAGVAKYFALGVVIAADSSAGAPGTVPGVIVAESSSTVAKFYATSGSGVTTLVPMANTLIPFTTGDTVSGSFRYQAASTS